MRIVDAFYRVRFGGVQLERQEIHELQQVLARLEIDLSARAQPELDVSS